MSATINNPANYEICVNNLFFAEKSSATEAEVCNVYRPNVLDSSNVFMLER